LLLLFISPTPIGISIKVIEKIVDANGMIVIKVKPIKTFGCKFISKVLEKWDSNKCTTEVIKNKQGNPYGAKCSCPLGCNVFNNSRNGLVFQ